MTEEQLLKALIYKDHRGRGWYAYVPTTEDSLDAGGTIRALRCDSREEAVENVRAAIEAAAARPHDTAAGMADYEV